MTSVSLVVSAILPLLGVALGASLQHFFSKSAESRKQLTILRTQAYVDYLSAVSKFAQKAKTHPKQRTELFGEAADAKARVCIYGSSAAIGLLAEIERSGAILASKESISVFVKLCMQMRSEGDMSEETVPKEDLELVLFGPER